jgi:hypothetical protein
MEKQTVGDVILSKYNEDILVIDHIENWQGEDDLETAQLVVAAIKAMAVGSSHKGLMVIAPNLYKNKDLLDLYQQADINEIARALVIPSFGAKIIGNMYLKIAKGKTNENGRYVPSKLFTNRGKAIKWLTEQLKAHRNTSNSSTQ